MLALARCNILAPHLRARIILCVLGIIVLVLLHAPGTGRASILATLSQYDPEWPLEAHTALSMTTPAGEPFAMETVAWQGQFYAGVAGAVPRFYFRVYADDAGAPGGALVQRTITEFSTDESEGVVSYSAAISPLSLPAGVRLWAELQAEAPAIPQWGLLNITSLPTDGGRLLLCPTLGFMTWSEVSHQEAPRGGAPDVKTARLDSPGISFEPLRVYPNPVRDPIATLTLILSVAGQTKVLIYDAAGRLVRTLVDAPLSRGQHVLIWDRRTDSGKPCVPGLYFVRIKPTSRGTAAQKLVLLRRGD